MVKSPVELADQLADYMASRNDPWADQEEMREAVHEAVRLLYTEAIFEAYPLMKAANGPNETTPGDQTEGGVKGQRNGPQGDAR